mgnify:CR=1 FL=1
MAQAVQELFPGAQVTIGPVIENGFYYDFSYKRPFTPEDLAAIEKKMAEIVKQDLPVHRKVMAARRGGQVLPDRSARNTRRRSSPRSRRTSRSRSTARATGSTCAAGRTCRRPAS